MSHDDHLRLRTFTISCLLLSITTSILQADAFDNSRSDNLAVYYGQNSYGATHTNSVFSQKSLSTYCQDDTIDAIPLAFLDVFFSTGGLPEIDLANTCNNLDGNVFPGTKLAICPDLGNDIKACQARGKIVTLSLGGATGSSVLSSDAQGQAFAETIWNLFLGGYSNTRPFGDAVLDGVDLDIESGNGKGMAAFVTQLRQLAQGASKRYYVTAAPQCPFPDANVGSVINAVGFDALYVQYNNYCGVKNYNNPNDWNFGVWDNWAKNISPNKDVRIYIGAPASRTAAGSGYVGAGTLGTIAQATRSQYSSFGGVMLWDMSQAFGNNQYNVAIKNALMNDNVSSATTLTTPQTTTTTTPSSTTSTTSTTATSTTPQATDITPTSTTESTNSTTPSTTPQAISATETSTTSTTSTTLTITIETMTSSPASSGCAGVFGWDPLTAYVGGYNVVYNGHLWSAKWWSRGDTPGGVVGVWADKGPCPDSNASPVLISGTDGDACAGIAPWLPHIIYPHGQKVAYFGHIWTAQWWTLGNTPGQGDATGVWADDGACPTGSSSRRRNSRLFGRY